MIGGDLLDHVGVADVGEGPGAARHAQVLKAIFGEYSDLGWLSFRKIAFESHDLSFEDRIVAELDLEVFAEFEHAAIEVKKIGRAVLLAPVAKLCFTAIETVGVLDDHQRQQSTTERAVDLVVDDDGGSRFF